MVVIPARDEAQRLPAALLALVAQCGLDGMPLDPRRYEVLVLANNCVDATAEIARHFARQHPLHRIHVAEVRFPQTLAHVGQARGALMDEALARLRKSGAGMSGVIASTDADTVVAPDWLAHTLDEVQLGAGAVGGRIVVDPALDRGIGDAQGAVDRSAAAARLARLARRDETYQLLRSRLVDAIDPDPLDGWPRHHQHFGASLALTVEAYALVGGLPPTPFLEDEALVDVLRRHDLSIRHSLAVRVRTSSRLHGRVAVGLSWQRREWAAMADAGLDPWVPDPRDEAEDVALRRRLRRAWAAHRTAQEAGAAGPPFRPGVRRTLVAVASRCGIGVTTLERSFLRARTFGLHWAEVQRLLVRVGRRPAVPMGEAVTRLQRLITREARASAHRARRSKRSSR